MTEAEEHAWAEGRRSAYRTLLGEIARELGYDTSEGRLASLLAERMDAVRELRVLCEEHGDNDWPDELNLGDVVEGHLSRYLDDVDELDEQDDEQDDGEGERR